MEYSWHIKTWGGSCGLASASAPCVRRRFLTCSVPFAAFRLCRRASMFSLIFAGCQWRMNCRRFGSIATCFGEMDPLDPLALSSGGCFAFDWGWHCSRGGMLQALRFPMSNSFGSMGPSLWLLFDRRGKTEGMFSPTGEWVECIQVLGSFCTFFDQAGIEAALRIWCFLRLSLCFYLPRWCQSKSIKAYEFSQICLWKFLIPNSNINKSILSKSFNEGECELTTIFLFFLWSSYRNNL